MSTLGGRGGPAILAEDVRKTYSGGRIALDGLDLVVDPGTVHGVLGPNGAGKSTAIGILSTLLRLDSGRASVAGVDVAADPAGVRAHIGVAGQFAAVDELLSGRQNLEMFARLHHLRARAARLRSAELLGRFDLEDAADRPAGHYSGGMRRRLDLAISLIRSPRVLFLDEPTTGLDPRSRAAVWDSVRELAGSGTTVLLTTQYLEEADRLCSRVTVVDLGRVVAEGSPADLKARAGATRVEIVVPADRRLDTTVAALATALDRAPEVDLSARRVVIPLHGGTHDLPLLMHALDAVDVGIEDIWLRRPDLDDVFLQLTDKPTTPGDRR